MKKYLTFAGYYLKEQTSNLLDFIGPVFSYVIHILVLEQLFDFIFLGKTIDGFTKQDLVWYVIFCEVFMYSFHYTYRIISYSVKNGDIAYNLSKPYNFMLRIISEQLSTLIKTGMYILIGTIIGLIIAGPLNIAWYNIPLALIIFALGLVLQLLLNLIVGTLSLWMGNDVSSIWWIVSKFMLLLVFTPLDFFPKQVRIIAKLLPTTHVTYTPSQLFVHFSYSNFFISLGYELFALTLLGIICYIIYKKGVKKLNVTGI